MLYFSSFQTVHHGSYTNSKNIYISNSKIISNFFAIKYSPTKLRNFASCTFNFQPTSGSLVFLLHSSESTRTGRVYSLDIWKPSRSFPSSPNTLGTRGGANACILNIHTFSEGEKTGWKSELRITNIRQRKSFGSVCGRSGVIYRSGRREQPAGPTPIAAEAATSSSPLSRPEAPRTRGNAPQCSLRPPPPPTNRRVSCWMALIQCCHDLHFDCVRPSCS